jgi:hypothetical protein
VQHFLRIFMDIVLWRRGPQDLPESGLLLGITFAAYVLVNALQLVLLDEPASAWVFFIVVDPVLLTAWVWAVLRLYGRTARFPQAASAVLGTGALLGVVFYLPLQILMSGLAVDPTSPLAGVTALGVVVVFALVTGRILKLATDSSLFTGIAAALVYFLVVNELVGALQRAGG